MNGIGPRVHDGDRINHPGAIMRRSRTGMSAQLETSRTMGSLPDQVQRQRATMGAQAVLEQVNPLPRPECQRGVDHGYR
jgi:hypothetical protein